MTPPDATSTAGPLHRFHQHFNDRDDSSGGLKGRVMIPETQLAGRSRTPRTPVYEYVAGRSDIADALRDILSGLARLRLVVTIVGADFANRYKGTLLGMFWLTATALMTVLGLGLIYSQIFQTDFRSYLPYVAMGMMVWGMLSAFVTEGTGVFSNAQSVYSQMRLPVSLFVYTLVGRTAYAFFFRSLVLVPLLLVRGEPIGLIDAAEALGGLFLLFWIGLWAAYPLGLLGARYKDTSQFAAAFVTFTFFITPVFWQGDRLGEYSYLVDFNPFHHFINVVRGPLLNLPDVGLSFIVAGAVAVILPVMAVLCLAAHRHRMAYW